MSLADTGKSNYAKYKQAAAAVLRHDGQIKSRNLTPDEQIQPSINLPADIGADVEAMLAEVAEGLFDGKKTRGRNKSTIKLIEAMYKIAEESHCPRCPRSIGHSSSPARTARSRGLGSSTKLVSLN
jgi:hypothetical protein